MTNNLMDGIDPVWLGIGGTVLASLVFANGYCSFQYGGIQRKMGIFHMALAPLFVVMLWLIILAYT